MIRWAVRLAFITALLGLAGTVLILFRIHSKNEVRKNTIQNNKTFVKKDSLKLEADTIKALSKDTSIAVKPGIGEKKVDTIIEVTPKETEKTTPTSAAVTEQSKTHVAELLKTKEQPKKTKKHEKKSFTLKELRGIVKVINKLRQENTNVANCVQLQITEEEYSKKIMSQTETYLKSKKFNLAGKEVISKKINGVKIKVIGNCVRVTIGIF